MLNDSGITRWNDLFSWRDFADLQREVGRLFDDYTPNSRALTAAQRAYAPMCDVQETEDHYLMSFDLPGVSKDNIKIEMVDHQLTISGERKHENESKNRAYQWSERSYGKFQRMFTLPTTVDADKIEASYQDGVLRLAVPKAESSRPRQIQIGEGKPSVFGRLLGKSSDKKDTKVA